METVLTCDPIFAVAPTENRACAYTADHVLALATQGVGHGDERRILDLLGEVTHERFPFDRRSKLRSGLALLNDIRRRRPALVVMEGTGLAGGAALVLGRMLFGVRYVVSSGDAVAPYLSARLPIGAPLFGLYERMLCRWSSGFIGWTPYLAGRALTLGAPRAMTAEGWAAHRLSEAQRQNARARLRRSLGFGEDDIVFGIAGSLRWNTRFSYCYGAELVAAATRCARPDVRVLIVGDGDGAERLRAAAGKMLGSRVVMAGRVAPECVPEHLAAMDVGSLPQSCDGVGSFRYSIKLSEYVAASLPVVTGQIPRAYDLDGGWLWRLPGRAPWDRRYVDALATLMDRISSIEIGEKARAVVRLASTFSRVEQAARVREFVSDVLEERRAASHVQ